MRFEWHTTESFAAEFQPDKLNEGPATPGVMAHFDEDKLLQVARVL